MYQFIYIYLYKEIRKLISSLFFRVRGPGSVPTGWGVQQGDKAAPVGPRPSEIREVDAG